MSEITLTVNNRTFADWTDQSVSRSIGDGVSTFDFQLIDEASLVPIEINDEVTIHCGDDLVLTGYIQEIGDSVSPDDDYQDVSGESKTVDFIESSAIVDGFEIQPRKIDELTRLLAKDHSINVLIDADPGDPLGVFRISPGETNLAVLDRAMRNRGFALTDTPEGDLKLFQMTASDVSDRLIEGDNLISISARRNVERERSEVTVHGQKPGTDSAHGRAAAAIKATAKNTNVKRHRPLILVAEEPGDLNAIRTRTDMEMAARSAEGLTASATLYGWKTRAGKLWEPGMLVYVRSRRARIDTNLAIQSVNWTIDDQAGPITNLELVRPDSLTPKPMENAPNYGSRQNQSGQQATNSPQGSGASDIWTQTKGEAAQ